MFMLLLGEKFNKKMVVIQCIKKGKAYYISNFWHLFCYTIGIYSEPRQLYILYIPLSGFRTNPQTLHKLVIKFFPSNLYLNNHEGS